MREYPIVDGVPLLIAGLREYVQNQAAALWERRDWQPRTTTLLGDCLGPNTAWDQLRQHQSSYVWDHFAAHDPDEPAAPPQPGGPVRMLERAVELAGPFPVGPAVDVGCAVGGATWKLAQLVQGLVLGIDLNFGFLRTAWQILRSGQVQYDRRRVGLVYDRRTFAIPQARGEQIDFWAADALSLPLPESSFDSAVALNVLDSIADPYRLLLALAAAVRPGGRLVVACPFDWSAQATPLERWLGGHSQRGPNQGASEPVVRALVSARDAGSPGLWRTLAEDPSVPWQVRLHDRSYVQYRAWLLVAERTEAPVAMA